MAPNVALAKAIIQAADAHYGSYDHEAAGEARHENHQCLLHGQPTQHTDFNQFYRIDKREAANTVQPPELAEPVYLLLTLAWNDALDWAESQVNEATED